MQTIVKQRLLSLVLLLGAAAGCDTTSQEIQREQASQRATILELQERQDALNVDLQGTQEENARLRMQIEELRAELAASRSSGERYEQDIARLDQLVQKLNTAREKDRQVILDEVSRELARMSSRAPSASPPKKSEKPQVGYEHKVKKGETLYAISSAYGVPVAVILKANGLKKGASLRAGQVLFIPRP
jgi:LysM repeat protein